MLGNITLILAHFWIFAIKRLIIAKIKRFQLNFYQISQQDT